MIIEDLNIGIIAYTIQKDNAQGEIVESVTAEKPRTLLFGMGQVMKSFAEGLQGLTTGDSFAFSIKAEKAFGMYDENKIFEMPLEVFRIDGKLRTDLLVEGKTLTLTNEEGQIIKAHIIKIESDKVILDENHPLAGHDLFVKGKVIEVRKPTIDEMNAAVEKRQHCGHCNHHHDESHHCNGECC